MRDSPTVARVRFVITDAGRLAVLTADDCRCVERTFDGMMVVCPRCETCWARVDLTRGQRHD